LCNLYTTKYLGYRVNKFGDTLKYFYIIVSTLLEFSKELKWNQLVYIEIIYTVETDL
jgi:acid stress-induced BolA-like protein IbaG/YrbA